MRFRCMKRNSKGGSLVEFALTLPMLFLLILNVVNLGGYIYTWIAVSNAARAGADYMVLGTGSVGSPNQTADSSTVNLVKADLHNLPHNTSDAAVTVVVCTPYSSPSCTPPTDPESSVLYRDGSVDVTFTYTPFFGSGFKVLGVPLTIPATSIHRKATFRLIQ